MLFSRLDDEARCEGALGGTQSASHRQILGLGAQHHLCARSTANGHSCGDNMQCDQHLTSFASCSPTPTPLHSQVLGGPLQSRNPYLSQSKANKPPEHQVPSSDSHLQHFTSRSGNSHA